MSEVWLIAAIVGYWTFAVSVLAIAAQHQDVDWFTIGCAALWPLVAVFVLVALPYRALVRSTKAIRNDLHNRKLMKEFNEFLKERNANKA